MQLDQQAINAVIDAATSAGQAIMSIYGNLKADQVASKADATPVTHADLQANAIISRALARILPDVPILSEESACPDVSERSTWPRYWLVDPLDGTREFIDGTGEFTVNIALVEQGIPTFGVIHVPVTGEVYWGGSPYGAFKRVDGEDQNIRATAFKGPVQGSVVTLLQSRRHGRSEEGAIIDALKASGAETEVMTAGSSLKYCLMAEGKGDLSLRFGPTSEWDTGAAEAILSASGGCLIFAGRPDHRYNCSQTVLNPSFIALADADSELRLWLKGALRDSWDIKV